MTIKARLKDWDCEVVFAEYSNGRPAILLKDAEDGSPIATATINLPEVPLRENQVIIKDYSENEGVLQALVDAGVVTDTGIKMQVGFAIAPLCELVEVGDAVA